MEENEQHSRFWKEGNMIPVIYDSSVSFEMRISHVLRLAIVCHLKGEIGWCKSKFIQRNRIREVFKPAILKTPMRWTALRLLY